VVTSVVVVVALAVVSLGQDDGLLPRREDDGLLLNVSLSRRRLPVREHQRVLLVNSLSRETYLHVPVRLVLVVSVLITAERAG